MKAVLLIGGFSTTMRPITLSLPLPLLEFCNKTLLMHQLSHRVAPRRIIIEVHSEWGLPPSFYADIRRLRQLYEPIGCRVTLGTVLRHPVAWYFSLFAWRAANRIPLCQWSPWYDGMARQFTGHSLPFVPAAKRKMRLQPAAVSELLREFDVVGVSERFEESLLLLGARAGLRHLAHFRMGDNNKPNFPRLTRALVQAILRDAAARLPNGSVPALTDPFLPEYSSPSSPVLSPVLVAAVPFQLCPLGAAARQAMALEQRAGGAASANPTAVTSAFPAYSPASSAPESGLGTPTPQRQRTQQPRQPATAWSPHYQSRLATLRGWRWGWFGGRGGSRRSWSAAPPPPPAP